MTNDRRPLIAANWKMNKTNAEATAFCADFPARDLPPATTLSSARPIRRSARLSTRSPDRS